MCRTASAAFILAAVILGGCQDKQAGLGQPGDEELVVLCPKIFASVMKEIAPEFEEANPGCRVKLDVYLLRPMLRDILKGKKGDVFLSIGDVELSHLYAKALATRESEKAFAKMPVVVLAAGGNPLGITALEGVASSKVKRVSVPHPEFNSAGAAFVEAAKRAGIYDRIADRLHLAPGPNSATKHMQEGHADVSVTYLRCYHGHAKANALVATLSSGPHSPAVCRGVVLACCTRTGTAEKLLDFLLTPESQRRFAEARFEKIGR